MEQIEETKETILTDVCHILKNYSSERQNLLPVLQDIQERLGYLPVQAMEKVADALGIPAVDVYGIVTFFKQFRLHPPGKHQLKVCLGTACYMAGGRVALDSFARRLDIREGETTPDGEFSLEQAACVGCCSLAPVAVADDFVEGRVTPTRVDGILLSLGVGETKGQASESTKEE